MTLVQTYKEHLSKFIQFINEGSIRIKILVQKLERLNAYL